MTAVLDSKVLRHAAKVLKCLSHPDRLRLAERLEGRSRTVGELVSALRKDQASVSKQLAILRRDGVVRSRVERNFRYYEIADPAVYRILRCVRACS